MPITTLQDYQNELAKLDQLDTNSIYIKRANEYFHVCDYMLKSWIEPLTEKWKQRIAKGERWFPLEEDSLYIKPSTGKLYQAHQNLQKITFLPGQNTFNIPTLEFEKDVIWQPYISWHGGQATNAMRGRNHEEGTISIKGYKPHNMHLGFEAAKESKVEYSHRIAPSISKDRIAGAAHMVASVIAHNSSLSLTKVDKPANATILGKFDVAVRPVINPSGSNCVIDMTEYAGAKFVVMFFVHHAVFNSEYSIKPELDSRIISEPFTIQSQYGGSVNCTMVTYAIDDKINLEKSPLIFWANSSDPTQQMFIQLSDIA